MALRPLQISVSFILSFFLSLLRQKAALRRHVPGFVIVTTTDLKIPAGIIDKLRPISSGRNEEKHYMIQHKHAKAASCEMSSHESLNLRNVLRQNDSCFSISV
jgi:hypothetical protein